MRAYVTAAVSFLFDFLTVYFVAIYINWGFECVKKCPLDDDNRKSTDIVKIWRIFNEK